MENVDEESAWAVSSTLRRVCYGVLLGPQGADKIEVKEYIRKEAKFEENPVRPLQNSIFFTTFRIDFFLLQ